MSVRLTTAEPRRALTAANKLIVQAAAKADPAEKDLRLVPICDGKDGYVEV